MRSSRWARFILVAIWVLAVHWAQAAPGDPPSTLYYFSSDGNVLENGVTVPTTLPLDTYLYEDLTRDRLDGGPLWGSAFIHMVSDVNWEPYLFLLARQNPSVTTWYRYRVIVDSRARPVLPYLAALGADAGDAGRASNARALAVTPTYAAGNVYAVLADSDGRFFGPDSIIRVTDWQRGTTSGRFTCIRQRQGGGFEVNNQTYASRRPFANNGVAGRYSSYVGPPTPVTPLPAGINLTGQPVAVPAPLNQGIQPSNATLQRMMGDLNQLSIGARGANGTQAARDDNLPVNEEGRLPALQDRLAGQAMTVPPIFGGGGGCVPRSVNPTPSSTCSVVTFDTLAAAMRQIRPGESFTLTVQHSGKCLDVGTLIEGTVLTQQNCFDQDALAQGRMRFVFIQSAPFASGSVYQIYAVYSGRCLDWQPFADGYAKVVQRTCSSSRSQGWRPVSNGDGKTYRLQNIADAQGRVLNIKSASLSDGAEAILWDAGPAVSSNAMWSPEYSPPTLAAPLGGVYELVNSASNKCLAAPSASATNGDSWKLQDCAYTNDFFMFVNVSDNRYKIISILSQRRLAVKNADLAPGQEVIQYTHDSYQSVTDNELWYLIPNSDGKSYHLVASHSGQALRQSDDGTKPVQAPWDGSQNSSWQLKDEIFYEPNLDPDTPVTITEAGSGPGYLGADRGPNGNSTSVRGKPLSISASTKDSATTWFVSKLNGHEVQIQSAYSNDCLGVDDNSDAFASLVDCSNSTYKDSRRWYMLNNPSGGGFLLMHVLGRILAAPGTSPQLVWRTPYPWVAGAAWSVNSAGAFAPFYTNQQSDQVLIPISNDGAAPNCLSFTNGFVVGSPVGQSVCGTDAHHKQVQSNQRWDLVPVSGHFQISPIAANGSGLCLGFEAEGMTSGQKALLKSCTGPDPAPLFDLIGCVGGGVRLQNVASGYVLDDPGLTHYVAQYEQWSWNFGPNQCFNVEPTSGWNNGTYHNLIE